MISYQRSVRHPVPRCATPIYAVLAVALALPAVGLAQDAVTPTPELVLGSPCPARVALRWNVTAVPGANRVLWEIDDDQFSNPTGPEQDRLAVGTSNALVGQVTIDLRDFGRVLDGSRYLLRVVAKNANQDVARRSEPVVFDLDRTPDGSFGARLATGQPGRIELEWSGLQSDIRGCSEAIFWEIKEGAELVTAGPDQTRFDAGSVALGAGRTILDVSSRGDGPFYVRLVGKHGGLDFDSDVGRRARGVRVELSAPLPSPPTPLPAPKILGFEVGDAGQRAVFPGEVPFRFRASGRYDSFKVADCEVFDQPSVGFKTVGKFGLGELTVKLPAGTRTVCLELQRGSGSSAVRSNRATDTVKVAELPAAPEVTSLVLDVDGQPARLADIGAGVEPHVFFTGRATHYRFGSCIGFATRPWGIIPTPTSGELVLPEFTTRTPGLGDYCVQLRQGLPDLPVLESNTRNTQFEFLQRVVHEVPAGEALELARRVGFGEDVDALTAGATCEIDAEGGLRVDGGECRFHLFFGRALNPRWEVADLQVLFDDDSYTLAVERQPAGQVPELQVVLAGVEAEPQFVFPGAPLPPPRLSFRPGLRVRLMGPEGESWRMAFAR